MTTLQTVWLLIPGRATLVLGIAGALFLIAGRRRPQACTLWQRCAVAALLVLPVVASLLPAIEIPLLASAAPAKADRAFSLDEARALFDPSGLNSPANAIAIPEGGMRTIPAENTAGDVASRRAVTSGHPDHRRVEPFAWKAALGWALPTIWIVIAASLGFRLTRNWRALLRLRASSCIVDEPEWQRALQQWMDELGVRRTVELRTTESISAAMTFGWRSPVILIPRDYLTTCDADQRDAVLVHELTHVAHGDFFWHLLTELTACLYWIHPLMWLSRLQQGILRERICDALCAHHLSRQLYGEALVRLAGRTSLRPAVALGMMMAQRSSLRRRLADLADCEPEQCLPPGRTQRMLLAATAWGVLGLLIAGSLTARAAGQSDAKTEKKPTDAPKAATAGSDKKPATKPVEPAAAVLPAKLSGKVVDKRDRPVAKANLVVKLHPFGPGAKEAAAGKRQEWTVTTETDGTFSIPVEGRIPVAGTALEVTIVSEKFPRLNTWIQSAQLAEEKIEPIRLPDGRTIRGRIASPISTQKVEGTLRINANSADMRLMWDSGPIATSKLGSFSITIPKEVKGCAAIYPKGFAPRFFDIPDDADDVGAIPLDPGTSLTGKVLDKLGKPVAGTVVALQNTEYREIHAFLNIIQTAVKTDEKGLFTLPPVRGRYRIWVTGSAPDRSRQGTVRGVSPPPIVPQTLELDGTDKSREIVLREEGSVTIRGTVRTSEGAPVPNFEVQANMTPVGREIGYDLGSTRTGPDGRFALVLPAPLTGVNLSTQYQHTAEGGYEQAKAVGKGANRDKLFPSLKFDRLKQDVNDADFVFGGKLPAAQQGLQVFDAPADRDLEAIAQRENAASAKYQDAMQKAKTQEEQLEVFRTLDPRNLFAAEYLAFEKKHRGTTAAACAMLHVMRGAASVGDAESPVAKARVAMVDIATEHYLKHEDLDLLLGTFSGGPTVPNASLLLQKAVESPHPWVRAEALFYRGEHEARKCQLAESLALAEQLAAESPELRMMNDRLKTYSKEFGEIDVADSRRKAIELLGRVVKEYADVNTPNRVFEAPLMLRFTVSPDRHLGIPTVAERARGALFRVAELQVGKPVPEFAGETVDGEEVSSRQSAGRLTVLLFTSSHDGRSPQLRGELVQLQKTYPDEIAVIEVFGSFNPGDVAPHNDWPVVADQVPGQPLLRQWTVGHTPSVVIIDAQGNLRSDTMLSASSLGPFVKAAMKGQ